MKRLLALLLFLTLMLGGCYLDPAESLYAVPKQPESFYDLQSAINKLIDKGASYSAPTEGENQQAVHMTNLDADLQEEAIVFLKTDGDMPLSVCVFDRRGERYELVGRADGAGYAFDSALYLSLDEHYGNEIVVGRRISEGVPQVLSVYALRDEGLTELMSTSYAEFTIADLDDNGKRELIAFHSDDESDNGVAEYFRWEDGEIVRERETRLSAPVDAIRRIIFGRMYEDVMAVFVGSTYGEDMLVTDVFALHDGKFVNLTRSGESNVETVRECHVYSCDIDGDGRIELPHSMPMQSLEGDASSEGQLLIAWFNLRPDGLTEEKCLTYHNYSAGWYVTVAPHMAHRIAVTRTAGAYGAQAHSFVDVNTGTELFAITAILENQAQGRSDDWQFLAQRGNMRFVCRIDEASGMTLQKLREMFRFIQVDWNTGET